VTTVLSVLAGLMLSACSSGSKPAAGFTPEGGTGPTAAATSSPGGSVAVGSVVMPPFGPKVHVVMTNWLPSSPSEAAAVVTAKNFQLAYLYSEYTSGRDTSWKSYTGPTLTPEIASNLAQPGVTTESFTGTIRIFDMSAIKDPTVPAFLDVSNCFDNAQSSNTDARTGSVVQDTTPADDHYYMVTEQLKQDSAGNWQVAAVLPAVYYPRAKECKP
jgi:hypothetical protein